MCLPEIIAINLRKATGMRGASPTPTAGEFEGPMEDAEHLLGVNSKLSKLEIVKERQCPGKKGKMEGKQHSEFSQRKSLYF